MGPEWTDLWKNWGQKISWDCPFKQWAEQHTIFLKRTVCNLQLKISASKQHYSIDKGSVIITMCGVFFSLCVCTWKTKIICYIFFNSKINLLTMSLSATVRLNEEYQKKFSLSINSSLYAKILILKVNFPNTQIKIFFPNLQLSKCGARAVLKINGSRAVSLQAPRSLTPWCCKHRGVQLGSTASTVEFRLRGVASTTEFSYFWRKATQRCRKHHRVLTQRCRKHCWVT